MEERTGEDSNIKTQTHGLRHWLKYNIGMANVILFILMLPAMGWIVVHNYSLDLSLREQQRQFNMSLEQFRQSQAMRPNYLQEFEAFKQTNLALVDTLKAMDKNINSMAKILAAQRAMPIVVQMPKSKPLHKTANDSCPKCLEEERKKKKITENR